MPTPARALRTRDVVRRGQRIIDRNPDYRNSLFIAGVAKNSTALICDALNRDGRYRFLFEPFSDLSEPSTGLQNRIVWREYVSPAAPATDIRRHAHAILSGRVHSPQVDRWTTPGVYAKRFLSECRLNLWLKWLHVNFPGMPIVLVTRHPCAVVCSRLLLEKETRLPSILHDQAFVDRYLRPFASTIAGARSQLEKHALMWAIEHYVPLHEFQGDSLHVLPYERFVARPDAVMNELGSYANFEIARGGSLSSRRLKEHAAVLDAWHRHLSLDDARRIMEIVAQFGLDMYELDTLSRSAALPMKAVADPIPVATEPQGEQITPARNQWADTVSLELRENLRSFQRYIERLKQVLFVISNGDRWQMYDWDWIWPRHAACIVHDDSWQALREAPLGVTDGVAASIEGVYEDLRRTPPALSHWAAQWDGETNTFLRYMIDRLDAHAGAVASRVMCVCESLGPARRLDPA